MSSLLRRQFYRYTLYIYIYIYIGQVGKVFANGLEVWGPIPGQVISKIQKMVLGTFLFNSQHYKVCINGKVEESKESSSCQKKEP